MPLEAADLLPGDGVPNLYLARLAKPTTRGAELPPVRTNSHALNTATVSLEGADLLPGGGIPHLHHPVSAGGGEPPATGAVRHARDGPGMPPESAGFLA